MKTITSYHKKALLVLGLLLVTFLNYGQTQTYSTPGTYTFTVPTGVTSITVEAWGAGGKGGSRSSSSTYATGGGGGGAYARRAAIAVTAGATYTVVVGAGSSDNNQPGGNSTFTHSTSTLNVVAEGGDSCPTNTLTGATGGTVAGSFGATVFAGGNGATGVNSGTRWSGGGGSSAGRGAGTGAAGVTATTMTGATAPTVGGDGGDGRNSNNDGQAANNPGGGGGGAYRSSGSSRNGGQGGNGQVIITYTCPTYSFSTAPTSSNTCVGTGAVVTLRSNAMATGTYTVTYNLTGTTVATGNTATMNFTAGTPGTGTFTTSNLNVGATIVTVTNVASSYCSTNHMTGNSVSVTVIATPTANAGSAVSTCTSTPVNVTSGSSASNSSSVLWTSSGTGAFTGATSLTTATYTPSAADITAGSVTLTLTAYGNTPCGNATSNKTLTIRSLPTAVAGSNMSLCNSAASVNITGGSSATNQSSVQWTSSGTGSFSNATSMTLATYTPSAADKLAGSVTLTLTANAMSPCTGNVTSNKTLTFIPNPSANAGTPIVMCATDGAVNVTTGASASFYTSVQWTSSGTGTFTNATSIINCTYNPSAADRTAGSVTLTLTALSPGCTSGSSNKTLTIRAAATAVAGTDVGVCGSGSANITAGSSASNYSVVTWTSSGTGTITNPNSLTTATYNPSPADILAGSVTLTLTATGNSPCVDAVSTKTFSINNPVTADAGTAISTCSTSSAINITAGAAATNYTSVLWTSSGTGTFTNANSLTLATYNPSAADKTAGSVTLTLTASNAGCGSDSSTKTLTIYTTPTITGTTPATRTGPGTVILGATASVGTLYWYAAPTGGPSLGFGTSFTTPFISSTTTFYVEAVNGTCTSSPRTAVVATVLFSEIDIRGNAVSIADGDNTPSLTDWTDFGSTNMSRTFTIYNTGAGVLSLSAPVIVGPDAGDFTITTLPNSTVASGQTTTFTVTFNPTAVGIRSAGIKLNNNDTDEGTYDFSLQGTGVATEIDIQGNATSIADGDTTPTTADWTDFGSVVATRTFTIRNLGNIVLNVGAINFSGVNAGDFSVTTLPAATVGAYGSTTFVVTFTPSAINDRYATISIDNDDANESVYDFALHGFGIIPEIDIQGNATSIANADATPTTTDWTDFGSATVTRTFTIFNQGNTLLNIGTITFTGANATEFTVTALPASPVGAFSSTTFTVTFAPTATGTRNATISIPNNDSNENPYTFAIRGTGVAQEIDVQGNATSIADGDTTPTTADWTDFSTVALSRTYTIRNLGNLVLTLGTITFSGTNATDFSVTASPGTVVPAFGSVTATVAFNPGGIGQRNATMNIPNNDSNENPYDYAIRGTGGVPEINIKSQYNVNIVDGTTTTSTSDQTNFGEVSMDGGSVYVNLIIENTGTGALAIGAASFSGVNASNFSVISAPASTIAAGGNSRFKIAFTPTTIGVKNAMFSIVNNDSDENPYNFALSGTGVQTYKDTDGDGITDNKDIDDDNDGIIDIQEQTDGLAYPLTGLVEYVFLNETFGAGTTKGQINVNTPGATCSYCYEDGYGSACDASVTLEDGEYCVNYKITGPVASDPENIHGDLAWYDGLDHTPSDVNGRMAVFNASFAAGTFYETRIDGVIPNVPISYSFFVLNIMRQSNYSGSIRPNITVEFVDLNNNLLSSFNTGYIGRCTMDPNDNSCATTNWLPFSTSVNLGNVTSFIIRFKNNSTGGGGNDLAIDDIKIVQNYIDTDGDGIANIFDLDDDNDGIPDVEEAGFKHFSNYLSKMDLSSPLTWSDANGNGLNDIIDSYISGGSYSIPDTDYDGVPDYLDLDSDNDSWFDVDEAGIYNGDGDINGDGKGDLVDTDRDGILDLYDNNTGFGTNPRAFAQDTNNDNTPDYLQLDSDGDGYFDIFNSLYLSLDANNDGMIDGSSDMDKDGITDTFDTNTSAIGSPRDLNRKLFLEFDGRNDYGSGTGVMGGLSTLTIMAWVDLNSAFNGEGVVIGQDKFQLKIDSNRNLQVTMNGSSITYSSVALNTGQWYHVGATLGGGLLKLYLNGVNVSTHSESGSVQADASLLTIGKNPTANNNYFKGKIDEVRIFNKNLTDAQFQRIVYQEMQNNSSQVRGAIIPKDVGSLPWANVLRYYRMDAYKDDIIDDLTTASIDVATGMRIYNNKIIQVQQAPMPFQTERPGNFAVAVNSPTREIRGLDIMDQDWSIVEVRHNITETANNVDLGMFVNPTATISATNDIKIQNDWYLKLDGKIDLVGKSQLVQTAQSDLDPTSAGSLERDQQGQSNIYNYNYWCAPVGAISATTNNNNYTVNGVMKDGTTPSNVQNINFVTGYNGSATSPISIANYWIFKFQNTSPVYANWTSVGANGTLLAGQGYTMKGSGAATATQNFTFSGKPHNATITSPIAANNLNLSGNPYASALDSDAFILANAASTTGALYFWEHYSTNNSHVLVNYQGGYAVRNLTGGTPPVAPAGISGAGTSTRIPGRFIPVGQGFFVNGSATGGTITFNNSQRLFVKEDNASSNFMFREANTNSGAPLTRASVAEFNNEEDYFEADTFARIRLGYTSPENFHRQLLLGFMDEHATSGIDVGYDAPHIDNQPSDMYFINGETKLNIQGDGFFNVNNIYPIGVKVAAAGTIKFMLDNTESFEESQEVYIYDNVTDLYHSIRGEEKFSIELPAGTIDNRFSLRFTDGTSLHTDDFVANANINAFFTSDDRMITVLNGTDAEVEEVMLFNMLGQVVTTWDVTDVNQKKIQLPVQTISTGTYIVKVHTSKGDLSRKIIIK
ncbi:choice-of-anchor D domain-containing protein [Flavobacterium sp.]|uniref:choice-of-anchor D domain-containing protein n=1 Tax=Flavobacterium sp. TaxID=239 RepID=UPI0039E6AA5E